MIRADAGKTLI